MPSIQIIRKDLFLAFVAMLFLAGCNPLAAGQVPYTGAGPTNGLPAPSRTFLPTVTPIPDRPTHTPRRFLLPPLPTLPPASSATQYPDLNPAQAPSPGATALPTGQLRARPIGLIPSSNGLWAMYPNGSRVTLLTNDPIQYFALSPNGWAAAYITNPDPASYTQDIPFGYTLKFITLHDQRIYTVTALDPGLSPASPPAVLESAYQSIRAYRYGALAWSPNGQRLAFTSIHDASPEQPASSNVYIYTPGSGSVRRLTSLNLPEGTGHPYGLSWSPFGENLYYAAATNFGDDAGGGFPMAGAWVTRLDGPTVQVAEGEQSTGKQMVEWQTAGTFLLSSDNIDCGVQNLRRVHLQNNMRGTDVTPLWDGCYAGAQYNPARDEVLVSVTAQQSGPSGQQPGLYAVSVSSGQARAVTNQGFEKVFPSTNRSAGADQPAWFGYNRGEGLYGVLRDGTVQPLFRGPPFDGTGGSAIQPLFPVSNTDWLWAGDGLYVCRPGYPPQQIIAAPASSVTGAPGVTGQYYFLAPAEAGLQLYAVRSGDWQPYIVDARIRDPQRVEWSAR